jgi:hypothetical protein
VQGSWIFSTKWWLPLQVVTFLLAVLGSVNHQVRHGVQVLWWRNIAPYQQLRNRSQLSSKATESVLTVVTREQLASSCYCQPHVRVLGLQEDPGIHQRLLFKTARVRHSSLYSTL